MTSYAWNFWRTCSFALHDSFHSIYYYFASNYCIHWIYYIYISSSYYLLMVYECKMGLLLSMLLQCLDLLCANLKYLSYSNFLSRLSVFQFDILWKNAIHINEMFVVVFSLFRDDDRNSSVPSKKWFAPIIRYQAIHTIQSLHALTHSIHVHLKCLEPKCIVIELKSNNRFVNAIHIHCWNYASNICHPFLRDIIIAPEDTYVYAHLMMLPLVKMIWQLHQWHSFPTDFSWLYCYPRIDYDCDCFGNCDSCN